MKNSIFICGLICLLTSCSQSNKTEAKNSIPGTYVRMSEHEFGKEYDTLVISEASDLFQIQRRWKYSRVLDGVAQEPEYKEQKTTASFDASNETLHENETGNAISYDSKNGTLSIGTTKYQKLK
jgi:hypothetical protein